MNRSSLERSARRSLDDLCSILPDRRTGSDGNRRATALVAQTLRAWELPAELRPFDCLDWVGVRCRLVVEQIAFAAEASPFTLACEVTAPLAARATVEALEEGGATETVLLLHGELAREPLMPKNFPFYNPEGHRRILGALERAAPLALITATPGPDRIHRLHSSRPMFEDGDLDIPCAYVSPAQASGLLPSVGREAHLAIDASRIPSSGCNVVTQWNPEATRRITFMAHVDTRPSTPGALDNASGVATLLLLARLLRDERLRVAVEIVVVNGEDHYANPGEVQFMRDAQASVGSYVLGVNVDSIGDRGASIAYSAYDCPSLIEREIAEVLGGRSGFVRGKPWYQGDHGVFLWLGIPALALTSERTPELLSTVIHTKDDRPDLISENALVEAALALRDLTIRLDRALYTVESNSRPGSLPD